jgi:signal transduction histidine kinase
MQEQSEATTRLFSRFIAEVVLQVGDAGKASVLREVLAEIKLPVIFTDTAGRPLIWHRVGVPEPKDEDFPRLLAIDPSNPPPGDIARVIELAKNFDARNEPIPVRVGEDGLVQGYLHFGSSMLQRELRLMPIALLVVFLLFMAAGFQGFRYLKLSEQRSIYVGMAKETAHQLGTPLSALLGWTQLLRDHIDSQDLPSIGSTLDEMEDDLMRLGKVTERFSKIGSRPELKLVEITPILEKTVRYFHKRLPSLKTESVITLDIEETPAIRGNSELLEWVFENLVKNSIDALGEGGGRIEISSSFNEAKRSVDITVRDTGKGITAAQRQQIFSPGFTTKKRGWGLGLALTKRIVEEYHSGDLRLVESNPGKGAIFLVRLPVR